MSDYCDAKHPSARRGHCHSVAGHEGEHQAFHVMPPGYKFRWPNPPKPGTPNVFLTPEDIGIMLTALQPIRQFFPQLEQKLTEAKGAGS